MKTRQKAETGASRWNALLQADQLSACPACIKAGNVLKAGNQQMSLNWSSWLIYVKSLTYVSHLIYSNLFLTPIIPLVGITILLVNNNKRPEDSKDLKENFKASQCLFLYVFILGVTSRGAQGRLLALYSRITLGEACGKIGYQGLSPGQMHTKQAACPLHYHSCLYILFKAKVQSASIWSSGSLITPEDFS